MDTDEFEEIVLLSEHNDALLGCVYDEEGVPVPVYSSWAVMESLLADGYDEDSACDYIEKETEGMRLLWVHPLELSPDFEPDKKPHLRIVH